MLRRSLGLSLGVSADVNLAELIAAHEDLRAGLWEGQVEGWIAALNDVKAQALMARIHVKRPDDQRKAASAGQRPKLLEQRCSVNLPSFSEQVMWGKRGQIARAFALKSKT